MDKKSLQTLNEGFKYALVGIFLYPVILFLGNIYPHIFIQVFDKDLTYPEFIRHLLIITPCFTVFFFIAVIKLTKVNIGIPFEKHLQITFRILFLVYVIFSIIISITALSGNMDTVGAINDFKTVIWRGGSILVFVYIAYLYFELNELEWGIVTLGFLAISLFEDIYYYLLRIEALTYKVKSYLVDETLLLLSAIVLFGTIFLIVNLRNKINRTIKKKFPDQDSAGEIY